MRLRGFMFIFMLLLFACSSDDSNDGDNNGEVDLTGTLLYEVVGSVSGITFTRIEYTGANGNNIVLNNIDSPWELRISTDGFSSGDVLELDVIASTNGHSFTGRIWIDGEVEATGTHTREISLSVTF